VHVSVAVGVAAPVDQLPASRDHLIYLHPEWLMVPRQLAAEMQTVDPRSPAYLGRRARWTRANADRAEGLYVSPLDPAAAAFLTSAVVSAVQRHTVDGVHLDGMYFPGGDFDYSAHAMRLFRTSMRAVLSAAERARLDEVEAIDPFAYAEEFPGPWRQFRESALTDLAVRLRAALTAANPSLAVTVGARSDAEIALRDHFQNWRAWLDRGIVTRVGHRRGSAAAILFSTDGVSPPDSPAGGAQATGLGGPR
jgi:uncharacterized lipoprotein YddW (UPF0748 family)